MLFNEKETDATQCAVDSTQKNKQLASQARFFVRFWISILLVLFILPIPLQTIWYNWLQLAGRAPAAEEQAQSKALVDDVLSMGHARAVKDMHHRLRDRAAIQPYRAGKARKALGEIFREESVFVTDAFRENQPLTLCGRRLHTLVERLVERGIADVHHADEMNILVIESQDFFGQFDPLQ